MQGELAGALPPELAPLAGPATGALRQLAGDVAPKVLEQPRVQQLWEEVNRAAHQQLLDVVNGDEAALSSEGDRVYLDLGVIVRELGAELGIGIANKVPEGIAQLDVLDASDLQAAQDAVRLLERLTLVLLVLTLVGYTLAVYLAAGWRRRALRSVGFSLIAVGATVLIARSIAGEYVVGALAEHRCGRARGRRDLVDRDLAAAGDRGVDRRLRAGSARRRLAGGPGSRRDRGAALADAVPRRSPDHVPDPGGAGARAALVGPDRGNAAAGSDAVPDRAAGRRRGGAAAPGPARVPRGDDGALLLALARPGLGGRPGRLAGEGAPRSAARTGHPRAPRQRPAGSRGSRSSPACASAARSPSRSTRRRSSAFSPTAADRANADDYRVSLAGET